MASLFVPDAGFSLCDGARARRGVLTTDQRLEFVLERVRIDGLLRLEQRTGDGCRKIPSGWIAFVRIARQRPHHDGIELRRDVANVDARGLYLSGSNRLEQFLSLGSSVQMPTR